MSCPLWSDLVLLDCPAETEEYKAGLSQAEWRRCQERAHSDPATTQDILRGIHARVYYGGVDQAIR